jgi:voltage-gated sodium channel
VFTVLNLLIGIVLNAMDEARAEAKKRSGELNELKLLSRDIEAILSDGKISSEELEFLQKELDRLRSMAERS